MKLLDGITDLIDMCLGELQELLMDSKASVYNVRDPGSIPGLGRSPGEGNGNPLQDYCLEKPMEKRAW